MSNFCFICYSRIQAHDFGLRLADSLAGGEPYTPVWIDKRNLQPGRDWDEQIADAIDNCFTLVFVMTTDSVTELFERKRECTRALKCNKPVIPILLQWNAEMPIRL